MDVPAKHLPQCRMQKVRCSVVAFRVTTTIAGDARARTPEIDVTGLFSNGSDPPVDLPYFINVNGPTLAPDLTAIGDLPARFGVKRCLTKHYGHASIGQIAFGDHVSVDVERIVSGEARIAVAALPIATGQIIGAHPDALGLSLLLGLRSLCL